MHALFSITPTKLELFKDDGTSTGHIIELRVRLVDANVDDTHPEKRELLTLRVGGRLPFVPGYYVQRIE